MLKQQLFDLCRAYLQQSEASIQAAISDARETIGNETKSSAGDKYETTREMMQQEIDINLARLNELNKMKVTFDRIAPGTQHISIQPGALVRTGMGNYYIAVSAGKLLVDGTTWYAISPASPLGMALAGKTAGDTFSINGRSATILGVD